MRPRVAHALAGAALALAAAGAIAQPPGGGGGPPPGELPPGSPPPDPPLTPAQQLVKAAGPSPTGILIPLPAVPADAPMPGADPRDLRGTWVHTQPLEFRMARDMYGTLAPFTMKGAQTLVRRVKATASGKPYSNLSAQCRPPGQPWQRDLNFPFTVFQSKNQIDIVFEEYHGRWRISLDPRAAPLPATPAYMGASTGRWDGDTLVVETRGFKVPQWLDVSGTPLSAEGRLVQRIRKVDNGDRQPFLEIVTTIVDPANYTRPWSVVRSFGWNPAMALYKEYDCEEQIGDPSGVSDSGLVPEPRE